MNHSFDVDIAVKHGVHAAVLHQSIVFWVLKNRANGKHLHEGRHWTYNSARAFAELFPYLSADQIQRALKRLEEAGLIVTGCFNDSPYDRTRWYSTADGCVTDSADLRNDIPQDCGTYTSSNQVQTNSSSLPTVEKSARKRAQPIAKPPDVGDQTWADWLAHRKAKRASVTQTVLDQHREQAGRAGITLAQALAHCCSAGWQGFRADWYAQPGTSQPGKAQRSDRTDRQLLTAGLMTGAIRPSEPTATTLETFDVAPRVIAP